MAELNGRGVEVVISADLILDEDEINALVYLFKTIGMSALWNLLEEKDNSQNYYLHIERRC